MLATLVTLLLDILDLYSINPSVLHNFTYDKFTGITELFLQFHKLHQQPLGVQLLKLVWILAMYKMLFLGERNGSNRFTEMHVH